MTTSPGIEFSVEFEDGSLFLKVSVGQKTVPVPVTPEQAAVLGPALLAASVLANGPGGEKPPEGAVEGRTLPVSAWQTGLIKDVGAAVLIADLAGGAQLTLQFTPALAVGCGEALLKTGQTLE